MVARKATSTSTPTRTRLQITSDDDLSPEEEVAALESASKQSTDASLTALHTSRTLRPVAIREISLTCVRSSKRWRKR